MASILGFDPSLVTNNPIDREFRASMVSSIEQLGKNVQEGIRRIQTNNQVREMSGELQSINPQSATFPQEMMGVIERYPLALKDARGAMALSMLGSSHKAWMQNQAKRAQFEMKREFAPAKVRNFKEGTVGYDPNTGEEEFRVENPFPSQDKPITPANRISAINATGKMLLTQFQDATKRADALEKEAKASAERGDPQGVTSRLREKANEERRKAESFQMEAERQMESLGLLGSGMMPAQEAIIPGLPRPTQDVNPEGLIPVSPMPAPPGAAPRVRRFNPQTGRIE